MIIFHFFQKALASSVKIHKHLNFDLSQLSVAFQLKVLLEDKKDNIKPFKFKNDNFPFLSKAF